MADWSEIEVELIIADYFQMLQKELKAVPYRKSDHRKNLMKLLPSRSDGSIEFKHQNISATLLNNGLPYISGYKPAWNYQRMLEDKVLQWVSQNHFLDAEFIEFAHQIINVPSSHPQFENWTIPAPAKKEILREPLHSLLPIRRNYLEMEQHNRSIGDAGEKLVIEYEKWRLANAGRKELANRVTWISKELGDGAGYDVLSKNLDGSDMYIEVKSTTLGKETPIFFSKTENDFSESKSQHYHLYRIFDLKEKARMFQLQGRFVDFCGIEPIGFKGHFGT
jgi:hypothetical protein